MYNMGKSINKLFFLLIFLTIIGVLGIAPGNVLQAQIIWQWHYSQIQPRLYLQPYEYTIPIYYYSYPFIQNIYSGAGPIYYPFGSYQGYYYPYLYKPFFISTIPISPVPRPSPILGGPRLIINSPGPCERFVKDESIRFSAYGLFYEWDTRNPWEPILVEIRKNYLCDFEWFSDKDGYLGEGSSIRYTDFSPGTHVITVTDRRSGSEASIRIRIYDDLWELYKSTPSQYEINRIKRDFNIIYADGSEDDEKWELYDTYEFDQNSPDPSKIVAIAKLDILRRQRFSRPLPFKTFYWDTYNAFNFYEYVKAHVRNIELRLDCGVKSYVGNDTISLARSFSVWDGRVSGDDACKTPLVNPELYEYIYPLQLLVHEARHSDPLDLGHVCCISWSDPNIGCTDPGHPSMDQEFENGSGYAWGAMYYIWIYKYGLYDPEFIKESSRRAATDLLERRFCLKPMHSDPSIQAILDSLLPTVDLLMITTSLLVKEPNFEDTVNLYRTVLADTEGLSASYIELDSDETLNTYSVKANNPGDWEEVRDVLRDIIGITKASYIMILGGPLIVPRPVVDACCTDGGNPVTVPSDAWYIDFDNDQIVDDGLSISRLPDLSDNSSAVIDALQTAIGLHNNGGYTLDNEVRFTLNDYTTPPYGVCDTCGEMDAFFVLMSTNDYIVFAGHGSPTAIYSNNYDLKFSIDYIDSINLQNYHPVIIAYFPCSAGGLLTGSSTLSYEFMKAGAAAYVARTTTQGVSNYIASNFPSDIEDGMRIGPALFQSMRQTVLDFGDTFKASAGHICLYGDPTLRRQ